MAYGYKTNLKLDGSSYDVKVFSYSFDKSINEFGDANGPAEGGVIYLSLADMPKDNILEWAMQHRLYKNGKIEVISSDTSYSVVEEEVEFGFAACTNMKLMYERDDANFFTTLLTISPRDICIGRNNCWINKDWKIDGAAQQSSGADDIKESLFESKDVAIDGYLHIMGNKYEIQSFETEFSQSEDFKGQPNLEVKGGLLSVTLRQKSDELLNGWMFQKGVAHSGYVVFAPISRSASSPLRISFENGKCISFEKIIGSNIGIQLTILISAESITLNEIEHSNR